jgi:hypothetical protein
VAVPRKLLEVASHFREMPWSTGCQMATDESDEGSHLELKSNSIFGPFLLSSFEYRREHELSLILVLPYKIPIILSSFNKVQRDGVRLNLLYYQSLNGPRDCFLLSQALSLLTLLTPDCQP